MKSYNWNDLSTSEQEACLKRPMAEQATDYTNTVRDIIHHVKEKGDRAVHEYTQKFDRVELNDYRVSKEELDSADAMISEESKVALQIAYKNIYKYHEQQGLKSYSVNISPNIKCQRRVVPMESVGLYVPGGTAPLVSTTLMTGVPSQIAGCPKRIICTPCDKEGKINPHIIYTAKLCGITDIFKVGGAQAVAAMAYGTETIPSVDKILGPGNVFVTLAKKIVSEDPEGAALDNPAGPSEVCVIADETTNPVFAAADLLSQAEHDTLSQCVLIATSTIVIENIMKEVNRQLEKLSRKDIASVALKKSMSICVGDVNQAVKVANLYAAEHLILCLDNAEQYVDDIKHAGSIFVGHWSTESAGDYCSGTNHVLPTFGYARNYSGLTVEAFQKSISVQQLSKEGLAELVDTIELIANLEGLDAHANAATLRLKS